MLVIRRREGERILVGDDIEIQVAFIGRSKVKLAIKAPQHVPVVRAEARLIAEENAAAANADVHAVSIAVSRIAGEIGRIAPEGLAARTCSGGPADNGQ